MRFSQRIGKKSVRETFQIEEIDYVLQNRLWNNIFNDLILQVGEYSSSSLRESSRAKMFRNIWENFFDRMANDIPSKNDKVDMPRFIEFLKKWFVSAEWYGKYDLIEFLSCLSETSNLEFIENVNNNLKRELAGFTVINCKVVQITNEQEIGAIEEALLHSSKYKSVEIHLNQAIEHLSNRERPDYRNSVKESISAVESYCSILLNQPKAEFAKALGQIEKKHKIHKALKSSFSSLYGYTSDAGGIRHALLEDDIEVSIDDAKFMLISCSAFINYLKSKE